MKNATRLIASLSAIIAATPAFAGQIWVSMDQVRPYKIEKSADSIIVGNPGIVDISVRDDQNFLLFGKAPGLTNIIIQNAQGELIENLQVRVNPPSSGMLTYHAGSSRRTYNCTRHCEVSLTVGDSTETFTNVDQQVRVKLGQPSTGTEVPDLQGQISSNQ